jgi:hypothetical protein
VNRTSDSDVYLAFFGGVLFTLLGVMMFFTL